MGTFAGGVGSASSSAANGALGVIAGFLAGGFIAERMSRDNRYDLLTYDGEQKKNTIRTLLRRQDFNERDERDERAK